MKKALIQNNNNIVQVSDSIFEVHESLIWVDCPDNCAASIWTYSNGVCTPPPSVEWKIGKMDCYPQAEGQTNVVFQVDWTCWGCQENYCAAVNGIASVTYQAGASYTPYSQLTQDQVLNWVWNSGVNKNLVEQELNAKINNLINPPVIIPPLPWN